MSYTEEDVYQHTRDLMVRMFEIDKDLINMESNLYEDLDIDSIDAVDLMVELKKYTGVKIDQEVFRDVRTIENIVSVVHKIMQGRPIEKAS